MNNHSEDILQEELSVDTLKALQDHLDVSI